jgi:hypothetical protein
MTTPWPVSLPIVIQQRQGPVAGTNWGGGLRVSDPSDKFERAAEATATEVLRRPLPTATLGLSEQTLGGRTTTPRRGESTVQRTSGVATAPILTARLPPPVASWKVNADTSSDGGTGTSPTPNRG